MARESRSERFERLGKAEFIGPEAVRGMIEVGLEKGDSIGRSERGWRESRIRENSDEGNLGQWACGPTMAGAARKPFVDGRMSLVCGPGHRDQNIDIE